MTISIPQLQQVLMSQLMSSSVLEYVASDNINLYQYSSHSEWTMNFTVYQKVLESDVRPSVLQLKLGPNWAIGQWSPEQQQISKRMGEEKKKNQSSPDLNLTERLCWDLQRCVHNWMLQTSVNWSNAVKKSGSKLLHSDERDWWSQTATVTATYWCWTRFYKLMNDGVDFNTLLLHCSSVCVRWIMTYCHMSCGCSSVFIFLPNFKTLFFMSWYIKPVVYVLYPSILNYFSSFSLRSWSCDSG